MSKKFKALQISALLTAVSGATLLVPVTSSTVNAAEVRQVGERCWDQTTDRRLHNCDYIQYGLTPGEGDNTGAPAGTPDATDGNSGGPDPVDPYTS